MFQFQLWLFLQLQSLFWSVQFCAGLHMAWNAFNTHILSLSLYLLEMHIRIIWNWTAKKTIINDIWWIFDLSINSKILMHTCVAFSNFATEETVNISETQINLCCYYHMNTHVRRFGLGYWACFRLVKIKTSCMQVTVCTMPQMR